MSNTTHRKTPVPTRSAKAERNSSKAGHIAFDERGNAIFEWNQRLNAEGRDADRQRFNALDHPSLALLDERAAAAAAVTRNERGLKQGYNPYESGLLTNKTTGKKRDMRRLSAWIELKRKLGAQTK